jgi:hypothetical protein
MIFSEVLAFIIKCGFVHLKHGVFKTKLISLGGESEDVPSISLGFLVYFILNLFWMRNNFMTKCGKRV